MRLVERMRRMRRVSRHHITAGMECLAVASVVVGVALISLPAAFIVAGVLVFGLAQLLDVGGEGRR